MDVLSRSTVTLKWISKSVYWLHVLTRYIWRAIHSRTGCWCRLLSSSVLDVNVEVDVISDEEMGIVLLFALVVIKNSNLLSICCSTVYNFPSNVLLFNNMFWQLRNKKLQALLTLGSRWRNICFGCVASKLLLKALFLIYKLLHSKVFTFSYLKQNIKQEQIQDMKFWQAITNLITLTKFCL